MSPIKNPPEPGTPGYKVHKKLEKIDSIGRVIYKYLKKWILAIVGVITLVSIYLGIDIFAEMGIKNPNTPATNPIIQLDTARTMVEADLSEDYIEELDSTGYHTDENSEYYYDISSDYLDSATYFIENMSQSHYLPDRYIVEMFYDVDENGDTIYIDIYNDGTDSIYYKNNY